MADVMRVTQELFPGDVSVHAMNDPEYPHDRFTVIEARASGTIEEVVGRRAEWHKRVTRLSPIVPLCGLRSISSSERHRLH